MYDTTYGRSLGAKVVGWFFGGLLLFCSGICTFLSWSCNDIWGALRDDWKLIAEEEDIAGSLVDFSKGGLLVDLTF